MKRHPLDRLFRPESVAVVGASPKGGYGLRILRNMRGVGFEGRLYVVNPGRTEVGGVRAYPSLGDLPEAPDAVAAAIPAAGVPALAAEAVRVGAGSMVVYGAGFAERDDAGRALQAELVAAADGRLPLIGPNCLGAVSYRGRAALWGIEMPYVHAGADGTVALAAQSGNMALTTMLSGRLPAVAYAVSAGNQAVLDLADCLEYFLTDPGVRVVCLVMEGLADLARFRVLAERAAERDVAVIVLKVGRSAGGEAATVAHTGTLAGRDASYEALFRQTGVYRVDDLDEMVALCSLLAVPNRPRGTAIGFFASSGGECGLTADVADAAGVRLADLDEAAESALAAAVPPYQRPRNPMDLGASAWGDRDSYYAAARAMGECPAVDVVAFSGDAPTHSDPLDEFGWPEMMGGAGDAAAELDVPVVLMTMTTDVTPELGELARRNGVVLLAGARPALRAIALAGRPRPSVRAEEADPTDSATRRSAAELLDGRTGALTETESKRLLALYGVASPDGEVASDADSAVAIADRLGYPVVGKLHAPGVAHKSDIGGVEVGLADATAVREAFHRIMRRAAAALDGLDGGPPPGVLVERMAGPGVELIVGGRNDTAGSLVVLGAGGVLTELLDDAASLLWPFGRDDVHAALSRLRVNALLGGHRGGPPADVEALADAALRVGRLLSDHPEIAEIDVNPLLCRPKGEGCLALDALIVADPARKGGAS
ncbi:acetate--CoA ligase family protein [Actinomadura decatromicini]|uniref:Acetate--CoA ligase family protein n=1 Tax=Actinomadura decatromicini TaxID=2604572 RepID=A0A5D3FTL5_9ACTN|nr:acetate--CoA ligase family protein [Actinomadura decatromicini]TYK51286.1 acetate--CoA ligase family protein [Actinomadura decatromicini]